MKDKEQAMPDWMAMTSQSWTWYTLTDEQREIESLERGVIEWRC